MESFFDAIRRLGFRRGPHRIAGGICGGIADQANVSLNLVRVLMVIAFFLPVIGVGAYLVAWALLPWQDGTIPLERMLTGQSSS